MSKKIRIAVVLMLLVYGIQSQRAFAQEPPERVEPPFWWAGMFHEELQIKFYAPDIGKTTAVLTYPGVHLKESVSVVNPDYLFLYLDVKNAQPGSFTISFMKEGQASYVYEYELKPRSLNSRYREGVNASDAIYLVMPDRFANGDPSLDNQPGMLEKADRSNPSGRHGGDLAGIRQHLDFIAGMGFTAMWINPVLENNQPRYSYHGYATTDFYRIDPRFGSNEDYRDLVQQAEKNGIKIIKDLILNHCGHHHWWMENLPTHDWLNLWDEFTRTTYRMTTIVDPHGSQYDYDRMLKGWFDTNMPDLNQNNRLLARYLKQNAVWWIEYSGIRAIRMDTQPYADRFFMSDWARYVLNEYPYFMLIGEAWMGIPAMVSYYQGGHHNHDGYNSHFPSVFDFALYDAIGLAFQEEQGWATGMMRLYNTLAQDFLYPDPYNLVVFGDNHDTDRFFTRVGEDIGKLKMALTFIFTTRGIPQVYTGTELLESAFEHDGHGELRTNFPGGWPGDPVNAFTREGRTAEQNIIVDHITTLLNFRKNTPVLHYGWLLHFVPEDNVYVYFRYDESNAVMVVMNNNDTNRTIDLERFREGWKGYSQAVELFSGQIYSEFDRWNVPGNAALVFELR
ncbi:MAG: glycoside hydrolase family 13 protein [Bacteroidales bacterium]|nr:glycoside hydrolase family 13 protein [Bacteroidales bacterium]